MPKDGEPRAEGRFKKLVPRWRRALVDAVNREDHEIPAGGSPTFVALFHIGKHPGPPPYGCRACGASQAILFLGMGQADHSDEVRSMAKAIARLNPGLRKLLTRYRRDHREYGPTIDGLYAQHSHDPSPPNFLLLPVAILKHTEQLVSETASAPQAIVEHLAPGYDVPFTRKDPLALLDSVTLPLLHAFTDKEIARLIEDGKAGNDRLRVANRRRRLRRLMPLWFPGDKP